MFCIDIDWSSKESSSLNHGKRLVEEKKNYLLLHIEPFDSFGELSVSNLF